MADRQTPEHTTHFGYQTVTPEEKTERVKGVFARVAQRYDIMNDLMSFGSHRLFKRILVESSGVRPGNRVLDLAGGTGDVSALFAAAVGTSGQVILTDINAAMMQVGRDRMLDEGLLQVDFCEAPGESLPFADDSFHCASISFGLRNFTDKEAALVELNRVLKPGGVLLILEFSKATNPVLDTLYSGFQALWPPVGRAIVGDSQPYQYLVESIRMHPAQAALKQMMEDSGFTDVSYQNLFGGIAAIHRGVASRSRHAEQSR